jgi:DNA adenine methylase
LSKLRPPLKTHGGKFYLSEWVVENFPEGYEEMFYCEPFCAGASVFLNKNPSTKEVLSDIDGGVIAVFRALRDEPQEFINRIAQTRYTESTFKTAQNRSEKPFDRYIDRAVNEYVLRRMSRGGMRKTWAWSERTRGGKPGDVNAWETMVATLPLIAERVKNAVVLEADFAEVIKALDGGETLFYLDPPYLHSTRSEGSTKVYKNELSVAAHLEMLALANDAKGRVIISGYPSPLYDKNLGNWRRIKKEIVNHSSQSKTKERRVECLWCNY